MNVKYYIYIFVTVLVVWEIESININQIFKKGRNIQAIVFYMLLSLSLIYLVTNFIYDFFISSQIV